VLYWVPPPDLDPECLKLCEALNALPGVRTFESCCGHGANPFCIWFNVENLETLPRVVYYTSPCHSGVRGWRVEARTDCGMSPVSFVFMGPAGAFHEANVIADVMRWHE
jgi:hypothetical protein